MKSSQVCNVIALGNVILVGKIVGLYCGVFCNWLQYVNKIFTLFFHFAGPPPLPTEGLSDDVLDELAVDDENWDEWDGVKESEDVDDEEGNPDLRLYFSLQNVW